MTFKIILVKNCKNTSHAYYLKYKLVFMIRHTIERLALLFGGANLFYVYSSSKVYKSSTLQPIILANLNKFSTEGMFLLFIHRDNTSWLTPSCIAIHFFLYPLCSIQ